METSPLNDGTGVSYTETKQNEESLEPESAFICNVCLEITSKDPVVTQCGHLYCWPCLYRWLNTNHNVCPVCKAGVTKDNIIPLFIRGAEEDPRRRTIPSSPSGQSQIPNRPSGHRPEPLPTFQQNGNTGTNNQLQYGAITFTSSFGFFPSLFGLQFQPFPSSSSSSTRENDRPLTEDEIQQMNISKALVALGCCVIFALVLF